MPPPTPAEFRAAFPALALAPDAMIAARVAEAYLRTGPSWGPLRDVGAGYLAAHLLAVDPLAEPSRGAVQTSAGRTVYLDEWERLLQQVRVFGSHSGLPEDWEGSTLWPRIPPVGG